MRFFVASKRPFHCHEVPPMSLILHIGTHKTGTTSVQRFADKHRKILRKRGLWYPSYNIIQKEVHYAHHDLSYAIADIPSNRLTLEDACEFFEQLNRKRRHKEKIFLSAEPLYRQTIPQKAQTSQDYWDGREKFLSRFRKALPFENVTIIICIREQLAFARSLYQEKVKVTRYGGTFARFLRTQDYRFDYERSLELLQRYFPHVKLVVYEDLLEASSLKDAFFQELGYDVSDLSDPPRENESLPIELTEFKRVVNTSGVSRENAAKISKQLQKMAQRRPNLAKRKQDWIDQGVAQSFQDRYRESNERIARKWLPDRKEPLFPASSGAHTTEVFPGLTDNELAKIAAGIRSIPV